MKKTTANTSTKKICVIGGSGFVGTHVMSILSQKAYTFSRHGDVSGDILRLADVRRALHNARIIIHLAADPGTDSARKYDVIVNGTRNVLTAAKENRAAKIIFLSSFAAARQHKDTTARAKLDAEKIIKASGIPYVILRPTLVYGKGARIFNDIIRSTNHSLIPVLGDGNYRVAPVYVKDLARIIVRMIEPQYRNVQHSILGRRIPYNSLLEHICRIRKKKCRPLHIPLALITLLVRILHFLRILGYGPERILRATSNTTPDNDDFTHHQFTFTPLDKGLRETLQ